MATLVPNTMAPPSPCPTREAIRTPADGASVHPSEASV